MQKTSQLSLNRVFSEEQENASLKLRLKKSELSSLQGQMNPHFVFNALTSIQNDILKEDMAAAYTSIGKFAQLMRKGLEHSRSQLTSLKSEINFLTNYLELEQKRFSNRFTFEINHSSSLSDRHVNIPPLMIQPFCENAIKHGFVGMKGGHLRIDFKRIDGSSLLCIIEDNGIGIDQSKKDNSGKGDRKSIGISIVQDRINLFNEQGLPGSMTISSRSELKENLNDIGTRIELVLPME